MKINANFILKNYVLSIVMQQIAGFEKYKYLAVYAVLLVLHMN